MLHNTIEIETPTAGMTSYTSSVAPRAGLAPAPHADTASAPAEGGKSFTDQLLQALAAMAVRSKSAHWKLNEVRARHWIETARRCGVAD